MASYTRSKLGLNYAFLLVGFLALLAIVATTFWLGERAQTYFDDVLHSRDLRVAAVELRNAMQTAEASQRGFLITGNPIYLAPYQAAKIEAQRRLSSLQSQALNYKGSGPKIERLTSILISRFEELDQAVAMKRDGRDSDVLAAVRGNRGKALTDEANVFFAGIIGQADERLTSGVAEQRENSNLLRFVSGIAAIVIVGVVGGAAYGMTRYTRELQAARASVIALNSDLERRVDARTQDLAQARDHAEMLLSEVNHRVANSLALVSSLVSLQAKSLSDISARDALVETQERIFAISLVHKRLYGSTDVHSVQLRDYLSGLLDHLRTSLRSHGHGVTLLYDLDQAELETDKSISLGVIVTELVTNAFKYAYPEGVGTVRVKLKADNGQIEVMVEDDGIGRAEDAPPKGTGVGTKIINAMTRSLNTAIDYKSRSPGTAASFRFSAFGMNT